MSIGSLNTNSNISGINTSFSTSDIGSFQGHSVRLVSQAVLDPSELNSPRSISFPTKALAERHVAIAHNASL